MASGESQAGVVLGIVTTAANPPRRAASRPDAVVSASGMPGSRKWTCTSMKPGNVSILFIGQLFGRVERVDRVDFFMFCMFYMVYS